MKYRITPNYFAPKLMNIKSTKKDYRKTHCISYSCCNFNCKFCEFHLRDQSIYSEYSDEEFKKTIKDLIKKGRNFKFTGGESTLNPKLYEHIKIVKSLGGNVFLDTNGSNPEIVKKLLDDNLISVLGVSLKALNKRDAIYWSGCNNSKLCWDNVLETIKYSSFKNNVVVIVTTVFKNNDNFNNLWEFSNILENYNNVYLKINNLIGEKHHSNETMFRVDSNNLISWINKLIIEKPSFKNRIIYIDNFNAIGSYKNIKFF